MEKLYEPIDLQFLETIQNKLSFKYNALRFHSNFQFIKIPVHKYYCENDSHSFASEKCIQQSCFVLRYRKKQRRIAIVLVVCILVLISFYVKQSKGRGDRHYPKRKYEGIVRISFA